MVADDSGRGAELTQRVVAALAARDRLSHCLLIGGDPALAARHDSGQLAVGVVLRADSGVPPADLLKAAGERTFVWACLTDSMLALDDLRSSCGWQDNSVHVEVTPSRCQSGRFRHHDRP